MGDSSKMINLQKMQKKAQTDSGNIVKYMIYAVIGISIVVALAPGIFTDLATLVADVNVPGWVSATMVVGVGAGILFLVLRSMGVFKG